MANEPEPMTWYTHPTVVARYKLGKNSACTIERSASVEGLFVVKRWAHGLKVGETSPTSYELASCNARFLQDLSE